jgi:hypothetical protein
MGKSQQSFIETEAVERVQIFPITLNTDKYPKGVQSQWDVRDKTRDKPFLIKVHRTGSICKLTCSCHWGGPEYAQFGPCVHALHFLKFFQKKVKVAALEIDRKWVLQTPATTPKGSISSALLQLVEKSR